MLPGSPVDVRPRCHLCGIVCRNGGPCPAWIVGQGNPFAFPTCVRTNIDPNLKGDTDEPTD